MTEMVKALSIKEIFKSNYSIPLYQRSFAWGEEQISQLLQDIYSSYKVSKEETIKTPYYIGSLIVKRNGKVFEVIDGQQRLTVFSLLVKILEDSFTECKIKYESREQEQKFLDEYYKKSHFYEKSDESDKSKNFLQRNSDFIKAINWLKTSSLEAETDNAQKFNIQKLEKTKAQLDEFKQYIFDNVYILRTELPDDTDVAAYFEIMNNRGKQLQKHEILKSLIMSKLDKDQRKQQEFGKIWDYCSDLDVPIQKLFNAKDKDKYFLENWNDIISRKSFHKYFNSLTNDSEIKPYSLSSLMESKDNPFIEVEADDEDTSEDKQIKTKYSSIIDFPNFLMHVFKIVYDEDDNIPLDSKNLIETYTKYISSKIEPVDFIYDLLLIRVLFDRFIIKVEEKEESSNEDDFYWRILEPYCYEYTKKGTKSKTYSIRYRVEEEFEDKFIKSLSMLQVTFRSKHHKNWLQSLLKYLYDNHENGQSICDIVKNKEDYYRYINELIVEYFDSEFEIQLDKKKKLIPIDSETWPYKSLGTGTPHFLFNFIDYLYWVETENNGKNSEFKDEIQYLLNKDFNFRYYNSVEHHLAQDFRDKHAKEYADTIDVIDNLGNLCLISKRTNSRLQDVSPLEKVDERSEDFVLTPKRQIMYSITRNNRNRNNKKTWAMKEIDDHYQNVIKLLNSRYEILGV